MPLAIGHMAVGALATNKLKKPKSKRWIQVLLLLLLANSPDIDVLISYFLTGEPWVYHRTFTHSIVFAVFISFISVNIHRFISNFPALDYKWCYWAVMSHTIADYIFSPWNVRFLWPLPVDTPVVLNGILDSINPFSNISREFEVLLVCASVYYFTKVLNMAISLLYKLLEPV